MVGLNYMNNETNKWEENLKKFRKEFLVKSEPEDYIHVGLNDSCQYSDLVREIKNLLKEQEAPMGVSQWRELGKKYGYDKYFEEKMIEKIENTPIEMAHTYGSENAGEYRAFDAGQEDYKQRILNKFK